jgi:hypothetical protein
MGKIVFHFTHAEEDKNRMGKSENGFIHPNAATLAS